MSHVQAFFGLTYLLTWMLLAPWFYLFTVVLDGTASWWLWLLAPLALVGAWAPSVSGLVMAARTDGRAGVRRLLRSLVDVRLPARWYLFTLLTPPIAVALSISLVDRDVAAWSTFDLGAVLRQVPLAYAVALPFGPLGEELGWRAFALPRLLTRIGPVWATLVIGVVWTFWHVPMMLWMPGASIPSFMGLTPFSLAVYLTQTTAVAAVLTLIYVRTGGSVLLAVLGHLAFNTAESIVFAGIPPFSPDRVHQIYLVHVAVLAALGFGCLLWASRKPRVEAGTTTVDS